MTGSSMTQSAPTLSIQHITVAFNDGAPVIADLSLDVAEGEFVAIDRALDRLQPGAACAGRAFFVTNEDPRPQKEIIDRMLAAHGLPPCDRSVPAWAAWLAGAALEGVHHLLRRADEPMMTRFLARQLATAHWYDTRATREDLGYVPAVSLDEGFERLAAWARRSDEVESRL